MTRLPSVMGFVALVTMLFTVGTLDDALNASSPFQNSYTNTGNKGVNVALTIILAILIFSANMTSMTTTSREFWAFARDGGLPFHRWISKVTSTHPLREKTNHLNLTPQNNPGFPPLQHPLQRRHPNLRPLLHPLPHQPRLHRRLQHHHLPQPHRLPFHLPHLHRLPNPQTRHPPAHPTRTLEPRPLGPPHQCIRLHLLGGLVGVCVFS